MYILPLRHRKKWWLYEREEQYTRATAVNAAQILVDTWYGKHLMIWIWFCSGNGFLSFIPISTDVNRCCYLRNQAEK